MPTLTSRPDRSNAQTDGPYGLGPRRLRDLVEAADGDSDVLALLYGSDAIDATSARELVTELAARASDAVLAEAVGRLAAIGPRAADGVARALGTPLQRAEWVLDRLAPVLALDEADGELVASAAAPSFGSWTELANRIDLIVALTYAVLSDVPRTRIAFRTIAGGRLDVPIDLTDRSSREGTGALASPVLQVYASAYARRGAELAWSRWLRSAAVAVAEAADDLEILIAHWHVARSPQSPRVADAWRSVGQAMEARIRAERVIAAPPTSTGDDELDFFLVELGELLRSIQLIAAWSRSWPSGDRKELDTLRIGADLTSQKLAQVHEWLATFSDSSASVALERFLAAVDAEAWLFYAAQTDSDLYADLTLPPKPDPRNPGAFAAKVLEQAAEHAAALAKDEEYLLQRAVGGGFTLHRVPATRRGTIPPVTRWLCVSVAADGRARLDLPSRLRPVTRAAPATLRGRLLATSALRSGLISTHVFVWGANGWTQIDAADQIVVVESVPGGATAGSTLTRVNDVLSRLFDISQRVQIALAGARQPEVGDRLHSVDRLIASLPSTVNGVVSTLRRIVEAELTGRPDVPSFAGELERRVAGQPVPSTVDGLVAAAQAAAADWDDQHPPAST